MWWLWTRGLWVSCISMPEWGLVAVPHPQGQQRRRRGQCPPCTQARSRRRRWAPVCWPIWCLRTERAAPSKSSRWVSRGGPERLAGDAWLCSTAWVVHFAKCSRNCCGHLQGGGGVDQGACRPHELICCGRGGRISPASISQLAWPHSRKNENVVLSPRFQVQPNIFLCRP